MQLRMLYWVFGAVCLLMVISACEDSNDSSDIATDGDDDSAATDGDGEDVSDGDDADISYVFDPVLKETRMILPEAEAGENDLIGKQMNPGESFKLDVYEVPGVRCVRKVTDDFESLPEAAEMPGDPALFAVAYPDEDNTATARLLYLPHGNGVESLEALAVRTLKEQPAAYGTMLATFSSSIYEYHEQTTWKSAWAQIEKFATGPSSIEFLRRGWTLILPGNCWADNGVGEGVEIDNFYKAPRYTRVFDKDVIEFVREGHPNPDELYGYGCSAGGARLTQQVLAEPDLFRAMIYDSPNDYIGAALLTPYPKNIQLLYSLTGELVPEEGENYVNNFYGGVEKSEDYALGYRLGVDIDLNDVPILLVYATTDPMLNQQAFKPLAEAILDPTRYANPDGEVLELDIESHCPLANKDEHRGELFDWLDGILGEGSR